jgi:hypothetical protein
MGKAEKAEKVEKNVAERLAECLEKKKADYMTLGSLPESLKKRLTEKKKPTAAELKKGVGPYLGENLILRQGQYVYLAFRQSDESLALRIVRKRTGKVPTAYNTPFKKDEFFSVLNRLIEQGKVLVRLNKDYKPVLFPAPDAKEANACEASARQPAEEKGERQGVSKERFESAYRELEGGKFFVRVCDLRRCLDWTEREFDGMAAALRDAGKIQLQAGDTAYFDERDIADSFVDENGFRMLTLMWRG